MTEAQAYFSLPSFLTRTTFKQYHDSRNSSVYQSGGINSFLDTFQCLVKTYATATVIREAITNLHSIRKGQKETEIEFIPRLNTAAYRFLTSSMKETT